MNNKLKDLGYYLTLYKLEGHQTWRVHLGRDSGLFERSKQKNWPKVIDKQVMRIDRITGTFTQEK